MGTNALICSSFAAWSLAIACNVGQGGPTPDPEEYLSEENSVGFDIAPVNTGQPGLRYLATYTSNGKTARFRIELGPSQPLQDKNSLDFDVQSGKGRFVAEPGSDASGLLLDLKRALEAKSLPSKVERAAYLPFTFVSLGHDQSQARGGGFNATPPGNWTTMKLFLGSADRECDVFLNLNPVIRKGQFSIKDPNYGDDVLRQLAKVL